MSDSGQSRSQTTTFAETRASFEACLANYQNLDGDNTVQLLRATFEYLPEDGQIQFADDVVGCCDDAALRKLADSIDTGFLRPMLSNSDKTPTVSCSPPRERFEGLAGDPSTQDDQSQTREDCLARDGHKCVLTQCWDRDYQHCGRLFAPVEAAHIIPFILGEFDDDERRSLSSVWVTIYRYFSSVRTRLNFSAGDVNRVDNMMILISPLHWEFRHFHFVLEETQTSHHYRVKKFPSFSSFYDYLLPQTMAFVSHSSDVALPSPDLIAVHAAVGNILHDSGRHGPIGKLVKDLGECGRMLARDDSTDIGALLSASKLSVLSLPLDWDRLAGNPK